MSPYLHAWQMSCSRSNLYQSNRVVINVSGERYETHESTLSRYPNTLLGCPAKRFQYFDQKHEEYFFNRNRQVFEAILFYYQSYGRLIKPDLIPDDIFVDEIRFFEIHSDVITAREELERALSGNPETARFLPQNSLKRRIWIFFTYPDSSFWAKLLGIWSVVVVVMSIVIPCIESLKYEFHESIGTMRSVIEGNVYAMLELGCYLWFTFELILRLISAPNKKSFFREPLNIIDLITVTSYYLVLLIEGSRSGSLSAMRVARILRVFRIFKLSRYSSGMRILLFTFLTSLKELAMFLIFLLVSILLSSSAVFYAEDGEPRSVFTSIPAAFWWSVSTLTTLGYGDHYPLTSEGKLVGGILSVVGVLVIALPVFLFVTNFKKVLSTHSSIVNEEDDRTDQEAFRRHRLGIRRLNFS